MSDLPGRSALEKCADYIAAQLDMMGIDPWTTRHIETLDVQRKLSSNHEAVVLCRTMIFLDNQISKIAEKQYALKNDAAVKCRDYMGRKCVGCKIDKKK